MNLTNKNLLRKGEKKQTYNKVIPCRKKMILCSSIEDRPESINNRENYGHWEMDTVIGKAEGKGQVLLVLTERKSNMEIIKKINGKTEAHVDKALDRLERTYGARFKKIFKTITIDNGSEFLCSEGIEKSCLTKENGQKFITAIRIAVGSVVLMKTQMALSADLFQREVPWKTTVIKK